MVCLRLRYIIQELILRLTLEWNDKTNKKTILPNYGLSWHYLTYRTIIRLG